MLEVAVLFLLLVAPSASAQTEGDKSDPWAPMRFLVGEWEGTASGEPGTGTVSRRYEFVLDGHFVHERNIST